VTGVIARIELPRYFHAMESLVIKDVMTDRKDAGTTLAKTLASYRNSNAVIVGIPHGGVCVAAAMAESLSLPLELIPCRKIKDPANSNKTIGSVSLQEVVIHDCHHSLPQDYLQHQVALLRYSITREMKRYYGDAQPASLHYRPVILVDDVLYSSDTLIACLRTIRKQQPLKIIVAVPVVTAEAARIVGAECDEIRFIKMNTTLESPHQYFEDFAPVTERMVQQLFDARHQPSVR
jgi:predicted phosphoribosyltransferase